MEKNSSNNGFKIGLIVLGLLLLGTVFYTYQLYNDKAAIIQQITHEKKAIIKDLDSIRFKLDETIEENTIANTDLENAKVRIERLLDSIKTTKTTIGSLIKYKKLNNVLKNEMKALLQENEVLRLEKEELTASLDSTKTELKESVVYSESLANLNTKLAKAVEDASVLQVVDLKGLGVIERSNGKQTPTEKARRSNKIKVCYTIAKNTLAKAGDTSYFVQVIDPNNNVIGANTLVKFEDKTLNYSFVSNFDYQNETMAICDYISKPKKERFAKGIYYISVFNNAEKVSTSSFKLN